MSPGSLPELFEEFQNQKVLIIGDAMLDSYTYGEVERISPEGPIPIVRVTSRENRLGGAANVALNIQAMGAEPFLCSVIGQDQPAEEFLTLLDAKGVSAKGIIQSNHKKTTVKNRILKGNHQVLRVDDEDDHSLLQQELTSLKEQIFSFLPLCDVVIFEDYNKGCLTEDLIREVISEAGRMGKKIVVDPKHDNFFSYRHVDLFKPNLKELELATGQSLTIDDRGTLDRVVDQVMDRLQCVSMLITLSEKGVLYIDKDRKVHIPAHRHQITDVSGAGDTVIAVAACYLSVDPSGRWLAILSNIAGGLVCQHPGVVPINASDLLATAMKIEDLQAIFG